MDQLEIIPTQKPAQKTQAQLLADSLIETINSELNRRINVHLQCFDLLWRDNRASSSEILAALGENAELVFVVSEENKRHLQAVAQLIGKSLEDFIPADYQNAPIP